MIKLNRQFTRGNARWRSWRRSLAVDYRVDDIFLFEMYGKFIVYPAGNGGIAHRRFYFLGISKLRGNFFHGHAALRKYYILSRGDGLIVKIWYG